MKNIDISKSELQRIYHEKTIEEACRYYGVSHNTFYRLLDEAGIVRKTNGARRGESIQINIVD